MTSKVTPSYALLLRATMSPLKDLFGKGFERAVSMPLLLIALPPRARDRVLGAEASSLFSSGSCLYYLCFTDLSNGVVAFAFPPWFDVPVVTILAHLWLRTCGVSSGAE